MTDNEIKKINNILYKWEFVLGQRAGRELWADKPKHIQDEDLKNFRRDIEAVKKLIDRLQAEINHLENESDALLADIDFRDKENDKLQAENKRLQANSWQVTDMQGLYAEIKAEAYKEFAERLKESAFTVNQFEEILYKEDIDNLLKEMVGEDNA